jgi:hypothetical protein
MDILLRSGRPVAACFALALLVTGCVGYGVKRHFQQYVSYIVAVSSLETLCKLR